MNDRERIGIGMRVGHYFESWFPLLIVVTAAIEIIGDGGPIEFFAVATSLILFTGAVIANVLRHADHLCLLCVKEIPTDGAATARRHRHGLALHHWLSERFPRRLAASLLVMLLLAAAVEFTSQPPTGLVPIFMIMGPMLIAFRSRAWHRRLSLWCPRCVERGYIAVD